ncbi:hypothetical protein KFE25_010382 [Diacronema lutheri]|uniref:14-3-3 domain-containing protein n=1 Tax=Diacronema lutheri TaxID=2081491 RepID=A0A8J5XJL4_DIALT|nr:hypothetical protein KFE25_010382 [Diacronema lutheri]
METSRNPTASGQATQQKAPLASMNEIDKIVYQAKLAEQAERYDEMMKFMKDVATQQPNLSLEQRNLLSVAYKNIVGTRRASFRIVTSILAKEREKDGESGHVPKITAYKKKIEEELEKICHDILKLLEDKLIKEANAQGAAEARVFYNKMKGDYYRYLAEFQDDEAVKERSQESYMAAKTVADGELPPTHPIRLGLALNYSVFMFEVMGQEEKACLLAKNAFDEAIAELDSLDEESYKDSTLIMQLLRDNLTLWTSDEKNE